MQNHLFQAYCIDEREREANVLFTLKQSWPMYSISFLRVSCTSYKSTVVIDTLSLMSQTNPLPNSVLCPKIFLDSGSFSLLNHPNQALVMSHYLISIIILWWGTNIILSFFTDEKSVVWRDKGNCTGPSRDEGKGRDQASGGLAHAFNCHTRAGVNAPTEIKKQSHATYKWQPKTHKAWKLKVPKCIPLEITLI